MFLLLNLAETWRFKCAAIFFSTYVVRTTNFPWFAALATTAIKALVNPRFSEHCIIVCHLCDLSSPNPPPLRRP